MLGIEPRAMCMAAGGMVVCGAAPSASTLTGRTNGTEAASGFAGLSAASAMLVDGAEQPAHAAPSAASMTNWGSMVPR